MLSHRGAMLATVAVIAMAGATACGDDFAVDEGSDVTEEFDPSGEVEREADIAPAPEVEPEPEPELDAEPEEPEPAADCDPNYSGCVSPFPPDVDCADVSGPVTVTGSDPHGLDRDGDGVACEAG